MQLFVLQCGRELEIFQMLITVSGIGPKAGLSILGTLSADNPVAVLADDAAAIAKAPRWSQDCQKRIVELKDKDCGKGSECCAGKGGRKGAVKRKVSRLLQKLWRRWLHGIFCG